MAEGAKSDFVIILNGKIKLSCDRFRSKMCSRFFLYFFSCCLRRFCAFQIIEHPVPIYFPHFTSLTQSRSNFCAVAGKLSLEFRFILFFFNLVNLLITSASIMICKTMSSNDCAGTVVEHRSRRREIFGSFGFASVLDCSVYLFSTACLCVRACVSLTRPPLNEPRNSTVL